MPNNSLLLVVYRGLWRRSSGRAAACEAHVCRNGWPGAWRNGIYRATTTTAPRMRCVGIAAGNARVRLGGDAGKTVELRTGDVVSHPGRVAHKRRSASPDLLVIGSYPRGKVPDHCRAEPRAHDAAQGRIAAVPLPAAGPGYRPRGALCSPAGPPPIGCA